MRFNIKTLDVLVVILFVLICLSAWVRAWRPPDKINPLKVTIIDDGGADLKVESTVVPVQPDKK